MIEKMKKMRTEGLTYQKIAENFDVSSFTVRRCLNPNVKLRYRDYMRNYIKKRYHDDLEFRKKEIERHNKVYHSYVQLTQDQYEWLKQKVDQNIFNSYAHGIRYCIQQIMKKEQDKIRKVKT